MEREAFDDEPLNRIAEGPSSAQLAAVGMLCVAVAIMFRALSDTSLDLLLAGLVVLGMAFIAALFRRTSLLAEEILRLREERDERDREMLQ